ncbi:hypothetical protein HOD75_03265 [archaeon]|jgi:hypothetical protein|nr:hypothetical protein [archaeon]MBT4241893.1 hypothetical protein [archaeon]MBT4418440.1 hypothetical protein [archaeon]
MKVERKIQQVDLAVLLETGETLVIDKEELGESLKHLQEGKPIVIETEGDQEPAGYEFVALYLPGQKEPFYKKLQ